MWKDRVLVESEGAGEDRAGSVAGAAEAPDPVEARAAPGRINVTAPDELPEDIAKAYENLELRGIRSGAGGAMVAMISFVQGKARPASTTYAVGDTFIDERFPSDEWRVVLIDDVLDRVFLRRKGTNVALPLFSGSAAITDAALAPPEDPGALGVGRDEVIAQLREAGISEEEIRELMRLADADLEPSEAEPDDAAAAIGAAAEKLDEQAEGLAGVLDMMRSTRRTVRPTGKPVDERADTYDAVGQGHAIATVDTEGALVTLADGSRWRVSPADAGKVAAWGPSAPVSVYPGRNVPRAYVLVNDATKEFAPASHLHEPSEPEAGAPDS